MICARQGGHVVGLAERALPGVLAETSSAVPAISYVSISPLRRELSHVSNVSRTPESRNGTLQNRGYSTVSTETGQFQFHRGASLGLMSVAAHPLFAFDNSYVRELEGLYVPWQATPAPAPQLLALNEELASDLGLDAATLSSPDGVDFLVGNVVPEGASPVAQAYAGHQFGFFAGPG